MTSPMQDLKKMVHDIRGLLLFTGIF